MTYKIKRDHLGRNRENIYRKIAKIEERIIFNVFRYFSVYLMYVGLR